MRNLSKQSLFAIAMACGLSVAAAQESATQPSGSAAGTQSGASNSQQGGTSTASPTDASTSQQSGTTATSPGSSQGAGSTATSPAGASSDQASSQMKDGVVKYAGAVMFVKYGKPQPVKEELRLSEGITVQPSGEIELKDGTKMTLQEGQMVTLDNQVTTIPPAMLKTLDPQGNTPSGQTEPSTPGASPGAGGTGGSTSTPSPSGSDATGGPVSSGNPATSGGSTSTSGTTTGGPTAGGQ